MQLIQYLVEFAIAAVLLAAIWFVFLLANHYLIKMKRVLLQEMLGGVMTLAVVVVAGVILGFYGLSLFVGVFLLLILGFVRQMIIKRPRRSDSAA